MEPVDQELSTQVESAIVREGIKLPAGEVYGYTEAGNGEFGFVW